MDANSRRAKKVYSISYMKVGDQMEQLTKVERACVEAIRRRLREKKLGTFFSDLNGNEKNTNTENSKHALIHSNTHVHTSFAKRDPPSATPSLVFPSLRRAECTRIPGPPARSRLSFRYVRSSGVPTRPWAVWGACDTRTSGFQGHTQGGLV